MSITDIGKCIYMYMYVHVDDLLSSPHLATGEVPNYTLS